MVNGMISVVRPAYLALWTCLAATCLPLFGCAGGPPAIVLDTPTGPVPLNAPAQAMPGGLVGPPPGMVNASPPPAPGGSRDGNYAGVADVLNTNGGICTDNLKVTGFRVRGDTARFGGYRGRIAADGGVQMIYGSSWLVGQFEGASFRGQLDLPGGRFGAPGCTYMMTLERIGP
jgi:hypothetical protein